MLKGVIKYLLFLSIVLISGYQQLSAHTYQGLSSQMSVTEFGISSADFSSEGSECADVRKLGSRFQEAKLEWRTTEVLFESVEEEEDDEYLVHKKRIKDNSAIAVVKRNCTPEYLFRGNKLVSSFIPNTSHNLDHKYLLLQVFRL